MNLSIAEPEVEAATETSLKVTPGPILLLGAPGVGKGTQAQQIVAAWGIPQISTGDILRGNVSRNTELGRLARKIMERGELVPDELVNRMVAARLAEPDTAQGYILDGFPRTLGQAEWLDHHLAEEHSPLPVVAVSIRVSYNQLLRRITGRRSCSVCKHIYNLYFHPPKNDMVCDVDGSPLLQRADDTKEVFEERMRTYETQTTAVIAHYRALGRFEEVDGEQSVEQVAVGILAAIARLRS